jgi:hypothetical protein
MHSVVEPNDCRRVACPNRVVVQLEQCIVVLKAAFVNAGGVNDGGGGSTLKLIREQTPRNRVMHVYDERCSSLKA